MIELAGTNRKTKYALLSGVPYWLAYHDTYALKAKPRQALSCSFLALHTVSYLKVGISLATVNISAPPCSGEERSGGREGGGEGRLRGGCGGGGGGIARVRHGGWDSFRHCIIIALLTKVQYHGYLMILNAGYSGDARVTFLRVGDAAACSIILRRTQQYWGICVLGNIV